MKPTAETKTTSRKYIRLLRYLMKDLLITKTNKIQKYRRQDRQTHQDFIKKHICRKLFAVMIVQFSHVK